jgi:hypothetical protein
MTFLADLVAATSPADRAVGRALEFDQIWLLRCSGRPLELSSFDGILRPANVKGPKMTDNDKRPAADSRQDRLKSALRENLKRRKVQARERAAVTDPSQNEDGSLDEGIAGKTLD